MMPYTMRPHQADLGITPLYQVLAGGRHNDRCLCKMRARREMLRDATANVATAAANVAAAANVGRQTATAHTLLLVPGRRTPAPSANVRDHHTPPTK
mmetsp:Transcript_89051/g.229775  ORF Transcript_89051/g.229775 Transcript_89051/m.229775 type:complete len:97 (-) Transcript_89051:185-475(-)